MASPAFTYKSVSVSSRRFFWAPESTTAGTSPAVGGAWNLESFTDYNFTLASDRYEARETDGKPADLRAWIELTHHVECSWTFPYRDGGFGQAALAAICGTADDTGATVGTAVAGTAPVTPPSVTITPGPNGTACRTFSFVIDTGARMSASPALGDSSLLVTYFTVSSITLSANPQGILMVTVAGMAGWPTSNYATALASQAKGVVTAPASTAYTRVSGARTEGWRGKFTLHSAIPSGTTDASALLLTDRVTAADITIARQVAPFFAADMGSQNALAFDVGSLSTSGNVTFRFKNLDAKSVYLARLMDDELGSYAFPHSFFWQQGGTDTAYGVGLEFGPMKMDVQNSDGGLMRELTATFQAYEDESVAALATLKDVKFFTAKASTALFQ